MELYINDILVDLDQRVPFPLTFNISDIKDLTARKGNNSKTISLPGTKNNYQLMLDVFSLTSTDSVNGYETSVINYDPSIKATARYYHNGLLEFNGVCQLTECRYLNGTWTFDVILISETIDYMSRLAKIKVNELGWSEYTHQLIAANQQDSWNGDIIVNGSPSTNKSGANWLGFGYYYGLIDYGFERPNPDIFGVEHIPPQFFVREILDKAFTYAGISWSSDFFDTQRFKRLLLAYPGGPFPTISSVDAANDSVYAAENNNAGGFLIDNTQSAVLNPSEPGEPSGSAYFNIQTFDDVDATPSSDPLGQAISTAPLNIEFATDGTYNIHYYGDHTVNFNFIVPGGLPYVVYGAYELRLMIYKNGSLISNDPIYNGSLDGLTANTSINFSFDYTRTLNVLINDTMSFRLALSYEAQISSAQLGVYASINAQVQSTGSNIDTEKQSQTLTAGSTINPGAFLPDIDCATFFKGIVNMFNLYVKPSVEDLTVMEIEPLSDFYNGSDEAIDWTYLLDDSKEMKVTPTINFASKSYLFKFKDDDDYYNKRYFEDEFKQYGSHEINSQNQFATDSTTYELPFSQKALVNIPLNDVDYTDIIVPRSFQINFNEDSSSQIVPKKGAPFIVYLGDMHTADWNLRDETSVSIPLTEYPYVGHLDSITSPSFDLNFGVPDYVFYQATSYTANNLYLYHERFIKEIVGRYGKQLTGYFMLDSQDINSLDFKNLININGVIYRLQKVNDYDSGKEESTMCELIRILEGESISGRFISPPVLWPTNRPEVIYTEGGYILATEANEALTIE